MSINLTRPRSNAFDENGNFQDTRPRSNAFDANENDNDGRNEIFNRDRSKTNADIINGAKDFGIDPKDLSKGGKSKRKKSKRRKTKRRNKRK